MQGHPTEQQVWEGTPSQWLNFGTYVLSVFLVLAIVGSFLFVTSSNAPQLSSIRGYLQLIVGALLVIPVYIVVRSYLQTRYTRYVISNQRAHVSRGVFSRHTDDLELYRVDDIFLDEPFLLRIIGKGNVTLVASDRTTPNFVLKAVPKPDQLRHTIRGSVERYRDWKKTRVLDFE